MSEFRIDSTENRPWDAASGVANGRHRGPASDDTDPKADTHPGRHRRPPQTQETTAS